MAEDWSIGPYEPGHETAVLDLWRRTLGDRFPMRRRLWRQQTAGDPAFTAAAAAVAWAGSEAVGFVLAKPNCHAFATNQHYAGTGAVSILMVRPDWRRRGIGASLLRLAEEHLRSAGAVGVRLGAGLEHTFPGVPTDAPEGRRFFEQRGYEFAYEVSDLLLDLRAYERPPVVDGLAAVSGLDFGPCRPGEEGALMAFLAATFPGGWCYWTEKRLRAGDHGDLFLMRQDGCVSGFAHLYTGGSRVIGPPIFWAPLLGPRFGGLGPMGIAEESRGRGLGLALLCAAVEHLRGRGVRRMSIDWTGLPGFYAHAGFGIWRSYWMSAVREL